MYPIFLPFLHFHFDYANFTLLNNSRAILKRTSILQIVRKNEETFTNLAAILDLHCNMWPFKSQFLGLWLIPGNCYLVSILSHIYTF